MAKKPQTSKSVNPIKASPAKVKKVTKPTKIQKSPAKKVTKAKPAKKTAAKFVRATKKAPAKSPASKKSPLTAAKAPKPSKKAAVSSGPKGYTPDQYKKFLEEKKIMGGKSNQELKDLLRKNSQSMSGNKDDLIYKAADGVVLGRIPRCPKCFGGRPKFDYKQGTYYCSGYRDDEDFKNCKSTFNLDEIKRDPWE